MSPVERPASIRLLRWVLAIAVVLMLLPYLLVLVYLVVPPVSTPMLWRWVTRQRVERVWVPLEQMTPALPLAVIVAEDARFCQHRGVDLGALRDAIEDADD
ncbi:MAG: transglycosylase domain-containing protein, partial [Xanthobacteraceae bacterium]